MEVVCATFRKHPWKERGYLCPFLSSFLLPGIQTWWLVLDQPFCTIRWFWEWKPHTAEQHDKELKFLALWKATPTLPLQQPGFTWERNEIVSGLSHCLGFSATYSWTYLILADKTHLGTGEVETKCKPMSSPLKCVQILELLVGNTNSAILIQLPRQENGCLK